MDNNDEATKCTEEDSDGFITVKRKSKNRRKYNVPHPSKDKSVHVEVASKSVKRNKNIGCDDKNDDDDYIQVDSRLSRPPQLPEEEKEQEEPKDEAISESEETSEIVGEEHRVNKKPLSQEVATYELEKFEKNALLIFNHKKINGYEERLGTDRDVEALKSTFEKFGFITEPDVPDDLNKQELMEKLKEFTSQDFTEYGCLAVAVLTHGESDGYIMAKDMMYKESDIVERLLTRNNSTLLTKPRLLIVQACRGVKSMKSMEVGTRYMIDTDGDEEKVEPYSLPVEADMLVIHSSYIGKRSHRHELHGSWFIRTLCDKIDEQASSFDLESILPEVRREVAIHREHRVKNRITNKIDINKQVPTSTSTLTRKLYLRPYEHTTAGDLTGQASESSAVVPSKYCTCFLEYFEYLTKCLRLMVAEDPDEDLIEMLDLTKTFKGGKDFDAPKKVLAKRICKMLKEKNSEDFSFQYFYTYKSWAS